MRFRTKQMLIFSLIITLICSAFLVFSLGFYKNSMIEKTEYRRSSLTIHLHNDIIDMIYAGDVLQLTATIKSMCDDVSYIDYIFVIGDNGHLLVHTFDTGFPSELFNVNFLPADKLTTSKLLITNKGHVRDFAIRTARHMSGEIHVGMNEEVFYKHINDSVKMIVIMTLVCLALGLLIIYAISNYLSRPLENLSLGMKKIEKGDLKYRLKEKGSYEVLNLFQGYNRMTESILESTIKLQQAKEALREERNFSQTIINTAQVVILILNPDGSIAEFNPYMEKLSGYSIEEVRGKNWFKIFLPKSYQSNIKKLFTKAISGIKTKGNINPIVTIDGKKIIIEWFDHILKDKNGNITGLLAIGHDITEWELTNTALQNSEERLARAVEGNSIPTLLIDSNQIITHWNKACENLTGISASEVIGTQKAWSAFYAEERLMLADLIVNEATEEEIAVHCEGKCNKSILTEGAYEGENFFPAMGEKGKWLFFTAALLKDQQGKIVGAIATFQDITERKSMEEQFRQAQKMEAVGTLAGGVAHDFNNLLTVILGNAQLALMDVIIDQSLRTRIEEIKKAGDKAASVTRQLLAFSRKQMIKPEVLNLNEEINEIKNMLKRIIGEDIEIQTVLEPELWKIYADPGQCSQVIMNMVINARDAMPQGGTLAIESTNIDLDESYFREHGIKKMPGHYVMLSISDTGCGMDKETQKHIFEPFFTTKEIGKGTGLGLSTVYGIVKQNNGFVWIYSEPGQGTTFKIYLPEVKVDVIKLEKKEQTPVNDPGGSETILIVEDDDALRNIAQNILRQHGYKVLVAENGEDALKVSKKYEGQIHLLLTDVVMPKMGGKKAADRLQPIYPQMKVLYMSGYTNNAIMHYGILAPGLNFIEKPFTPKSLALKVRNVLNKKQD